VEFENRVLLDGSGELRLQVLLGFKFAGFDNLVHLVDLQVFEFWPLVKASFNHIFEFVSLVNSGAFCVQSRDLRGVEAIYFSDRVFVPKLPKGLKYSNFVEFGLQQFIGVRDEECVALENSGDCGKVVKSNLGCD
jgi:hypothetical protein